MKKRTKPSETTEILEVVNFMKDRMATRSDIEELRQEMQGSIDGLVTKTEFKEGVEGLGSKISGTNNRLDLEAMQRDRLQLPRRVSNLEVKAFGTSKHPKELPL